MHKCAMTLNGSSYFLHSSQWLDPFDENFLDAKH